MSAGRGCAGVCLRCDGGTAAEVGVRGNSQQGGANLQLRGAEPRTHGAQSVDAIAECSVSIVCGAASEEQEYYSRPANAAASVAREGGSPGDAAGGCRDFWTG